MSLDFEEIPQHAAMILPAGQIVPMDQSTGTVSAVTPISSIVGFSSFAFDFFNEGGPNNLLPGRFVTQQASYAPPPGAGAIAWLRSVFGAFVTDDGTRLTERPFGRIFVSVGFAGSNTLTCTVSLSDSNADDPVKVQVQGLILYFR